MKYVTLFPIVMGFILVTSCNDTDFASSGGEPAAKKIKPFEQDANKIDAGDNAGGEQGDVTAPAAKRSPEPEATAQPEPEKSLECWFAVSGTYVGLGDYEDTFPKTKSGNKISSGEVFDTVGGVFLAARPEPYVYGEGGKEIDKAVDFTFDGIVVPAGMSVEIRPAANAEPIHSGSGPLIAIAGRSEGFGYGSQTTFKEKFEAGGLKHWPQWMQDYLKEKEGQVKIIDTHPGRWVKVSVVDGGRCTGADK